MLEDQLKNLVGFMFNMLYLDEHEIAPDYMVEKYQKWLMVSSFRTSFKNHSSYEEKGQVWKEKWGVTSTQYTLLRGGFYFICAVKFGGIFLNINDILEAYNKYVGDHREISKVPLNFTGLHENIVVAQSYGDLTTEMYLEGPNNFTKSKWVEPIEQNLIRIEALLREGNIDSLLTG